MALTVTEVYLRQVDQSDLPFDSFLLWMNMDNMFCLTDMPSVRKTIKTSIHIIFHIHVYLSILYMYMNI